MRQSRAWGHSCTVCQTVVHRHKYANDTGGHHRLSTRPLWESAAFRRRELTIIGRSSTLAMNSVRVPEPREATRSWSIALGTNNVGGLTYFLKYLITTFFLYKAPVLSNVKHLSSDLLDFSFLKIFCGWPSVFCSRIKTKAFPRRTVSISHFIDFCSIIESLCCCIYQLGLFKTNMFAVVPAMHTFI